MTDVAALVAEFEQSSDRRRGCRVCDSEHRDLIDELLGRGYGSPSITRFLLQRLQFTVGKSTIDRHRDLHVRVGIPD